MSKLRIHVVNSIYGNTFVLWVVICFLLSNVGCIDDDNDLASVAKSRASDDLVDYQLVEAVETRNIMFVGRARAGKSTIIKVLQDKDYSPALGRVLRGRIQAEVSSFTMNSEKYSTNIHFNVLDTPQLFELTTSINYRRTNETILDVIKKCVDREITKINHVYFVMSIESGLSSQDLKAFELLSQLFVGMENKLSIILSGAQTIVPSMYNHYLSQFTEVPELKKIYDTTNGRIFFFGVVQENNPRYDSNTLENIRRNVYLQRSTLFEHIINESTWFDVKELKIYKDNIKFLNTVKTILEKYCDKTDDNDNSDSENNCDSNIVAKFNRFIEQYTYESDENEIRGNNGVLECSDNMDEDVDDIYPCKTKQVE